MDRMTCPTCGGYIDIDLVLDKGSCDTCFTTYDNGVITVNEPDENDNDILDSFNNGEWCDTQDICRLLNISFEEGLNRFELSRTAVWNKAPLKGQKITTKFRIKMEAANGDNVH